MDELADAVREGIALLPGRFARRQRRYLSAAQRPDGGFAGRRGGSDLYYTSFALRTADAVLLDDEAFWSAAADWFARHGPGVADAVEGLCLLDSLATLGLHGRPGVLPARDVERAVLVTLDRFRRDSGWAKEPGGPACVYHTFLADGCYARLGRDLPGADAAALMVAGRQCADGGFADLPGGASGVNPTAAAVDFLSRYGQLTADATAAVRGYLYRMQRPEGGLAASAGAPFADLLSTFTGAVALGRVGVPRELDLPKLARFVQKMAARRGGFRGAAPDPQTDVEYTWYGTALAGLLAGRARGTHSSRPDTQEG